MPIFAGRHGALFCGAAAGAFAGAGNSRVHPCRGAAETQRTRQRAFPYRVDGARSGDGGAAQSRATVSGIVRAWEVIEATGQSLAEWQALKGVPALTGDLARFVLKPNRDWLIERIARRFRLMVEQGGLDEVRALRDGGIASDAPAARALGVPQLMAHLDGRVSLEQAVEQAIDRDAALCEAADDVVPASDAGLVGDRAQRRGRNGRDHRAGVGVTGLLTQCSTEVRVLVIILLETAVMRNFVLVIRCAAGPVT